MSKYAKEEHYLDPTKFGEGYANLNPEDRLLPCPFCDKTGLVRCWDDGLYWIRCTSCGATGPETTKYSGEEGDPYVDWNSRAAQRTLIYWLLRAYQSGHREGWEQGPSTDDTMDGICDVLANLGFDPSLSQAAKDLLSNGANK